MDREVIQEPEMVDEKMSSLNQTGNNYTREAAEVLNNDGNNIQKLFAQAQIYLSRQWFEHKRVISAEYTNSSQNEIRFRYTDIATEDGIIDEEVISVSGE